MTTGGPTGGLPPSHSPVDRMTGVVIRHARVVLALWLTAVAGMTAVALGVERDAATPAIYAAAPGELPAPAGEEESLAVMVRGPAPALDRQGARLSAALDALPGTRVVSPWSLDGALEGLRPSPRTAVLLVRVDRSRGGDGADVLPQLRAAVARFARAPLRAELTGSPAIVAAVTASTFDAVDAVVRVALPLVAVAALILLLLVFRSPVAAAIPVAVGLTAVVAGSAATRLTQGALDLDALVTGLAAMLGLALGVGCALSVVARCREATAGGADRAQAVRSAVAATAPAILATAAAVALAPVVTAQVMPGGLVDSVAVASVFAVVSSVLSTFVVAPALLAVLGRRVERAATPPRTPVSERLHGPVAPLAVLLLLIGSAVALTLDTGTAGVESLPDDDPARAELAAVTRTVGPGWVAPFEVVVDGRRRPLTEAGRLRALADFDRALERDPGVVTATGIGSIERAVRPARGLPAQLRDFQRQLALARRAFARVDAGVVAAHQQTDGVVSSVAAAAGAAAGLRSAAGRATTEAEQVSAGLRASQTESQQLLGGLDAALQEGRRLQSTATGVSAGTAPLTHGIAAVEETAGGMPGKLAALRGALSGGTGRLADASTLTTRAQEQLDAAWRTLRRMTPAEGDDQLLAAMRAVEQASVTATGVDPSTGQPAEGGDDGGDGGGAAASVAAGVEDVAGELDLGLYLADRMARTGSEATGGVERLARGIGALDDGLGRLAGGSDRLVTGLEQLRTGAGQFPQALTRLSDGAGTLARGLSAAGAGTDALADGLSAGASDSGRLADGIGQIAGGVRGQRTALSRQAAGVKRLRPGADLARSGYFLLAAIDRGDARDRRLSGLVLDVDRGGHVARMLVVPTTGPRGIGRRATGARLTALADTLARRTGADVVVTEPAAALRPFDEQVRARAPLAALLLALLTVLVLTPVTRSLVLATAAALLNVLTVGAAFGALAFVFDDALLGGPGFVDAVGVGAVVALAFGLSIGVEAFVLGRIGEEYARTGDARRALADGLRRSGPAVGCAAAVMLATFAAFALSGSATVRSVGAGVAVAVFLNAFVVRPLVLPGLVKLLGDSSWRGPRWLVRRPAR